MTPYGVGKFNTVSDSRSGFLMSRASFQVPTCLCFDQWLLKWLVMQTAAASSAAAVCITRRFSNRWPRFPKFTRPQWVNCKMNIYSSKCIHVLAHYIEIGVALSGKHCGKTIITLLIIVVNITIIIVIIIIIVVRIIVITIIIIIIIFEKNC